MDTAVKYLCGIAWPNQLYENILQDVMGFYFQRHRPWEVKFPIYGFSHRFVMCLWHM